MTGGNVLRIGIAGLGQAGAALIPAIERNPRTAITAVADPREDAVAAFVRDYPADGHADIASLCASDAVDLVYVATPTHMHFEHVLLALSHGKHVIVEKPMATSLADADAMVAAARAANRYLIVGHSQSFEPPIRAMREIVRSGELGQLRMVNTWYFTDWLYRPRTPEELDANLGGGVVFRQGAHQVDLIRWIGGGMLASVRASVTAWDPARPAHGSHTLFLTFGSGAVATAVFSGYDHFHSRELTLGVGEDGRHVLDPGHARARRALREAQSEGSEAALKQAIGFAPTQRAPEPEYASTYGLTVVSCDRGDIRQVPAGLAIYGDDDRREIAIPALPNGRDILLEEACAAVLDGMPPAHDGRWAAANLEVCLAAIESSQTGREITLRHQVPTRD